MSAHPTAVIFGIELPAARWVEAEYLLLQDREKPAASQPGSKSKIEDSVDFSRIRCPLCKWRPTPAHRWFCAQCDYPEFFADGCGACWNTFSTRGRCPGCGHQWRWTACLNCSGWSPHENWYEKKSSDSQRL